MASESAVYRVQGGISFSASYGSATVVVEQGPFGHTWVNGIQIALTDTEHRFLLALAKAQGSVVTNYMLYEAMYEGRTPRDAKIFDVFAAKIRRQLSIVHMNARHVVRTVHGRGYAFGLPQRKAVSIPDTLFIPEPADRWNSRRKERVLQQLDLGRTSVSDLLSYYPDLTSTELAEWQQLRDIRGIKALRVTRSREHLYLVRNHV